MLFSTDARGLLAGGRLWPEPLPAHAHAREHEARGRWHHQLDGASHTQGPVWGAGEKSILASTSSVCWKKVLMHKTM